MRSSDGIQLHHGLLHACSPDKLVHASDGVQQHDQYLHIIPLTSPAGSCKPLFIPLRPQPAPSTHLGACAYPAILISIHAIHVYQHEGKTASLHDAMLKYCLAL